MFIPPIKSAQTPMRKTRLVAVLNPDRCVMCAVCCQVCPEQAITFDLQPRFYPGRCSGCGQCLVVCPSEAISLEPRTAGGA